LSKVYLTGAGPGDVELLTLKALKVIQNADVLIYDRLVNPEILELAKKDCELIKRKTDPLFKLKQNLRHRTNSAFISKYWQKNNTTKEFLR
jgi:siroheme synthase